MGIHTGVYSAHLHVRGVHADLCRRGIYEPALRPPLSTPILIIINDRRRFPTVTRGYARLFRGDAPRRDATRRDVRPEAYRRRMYTRIHTTTDRQERERMGQLCASRNISPTLADYRDTNTLRISVHTLKAHTLSRKPREYLLLPVGHYRFTRCQL